MVNWACLIATPMWVCLAGLGGYDLPLITGWAGRSVGGASPSLADN